MATKIVEESHYTVVWQVDDLKSSHIDPMVSNNFHKWLEKVYGDEKIGNGKAA